MKKWLGYKNNIDFILKVIMLKKRTDPTGHMALLVFVRLVNPIPTMGVNKAHYITTAPPQIKFWTFHCL